MERLKTFLAKFFDRTFLRFLIVGVINTLFGSAIMFGAYNLLHLSYWVSTAANYVLASILSYFLNKRFTFKNTEKGAGTIIKFAINICICYPVAYGTAKLLAQLIFSGAGETLRDNMAMLGGMGLFVILNYTGQRFFAFAGSRAKKPSGEDREDTGNQGDKR